MVGPGIWDPPAEPPDWLDENGKPLVLVTCSTEFQNDGKLARIALEALAGEDVNVVVTTAGVDPSSLTPPPNARVMKFLPHGPVLERAACVVCHGGMGIGHYPEGARGRRTRLRRAVRTGPARGRPARRGSRRRYAVDRQSSAARPAAGCGTGSHDQESRSGAHSRRLRHSRRAARGRRRAGGTATKQRGQPRRTKPKAGAVKGLKPPGRRKSDPR